MKEWGEDGGGNASALSRWRRAPGGHRKARQALARLAFFNREPGEEGQPGAGRPFSPQNVTKSLW